MNRFFAVFITVFILAFSSNAQLSLNGVTLPEKLSFNNQSLVLNGGGIRTKYFFKLYTAGLYLSQKSSDAKAIVKADKIMAVHFEITSDMINSENMSEAINEGFDKSTDGNTAKLRARIDELLKAFSSEAINIGDKFDIVYIPTIGVQTYKNSTLKSTLTGLDFKQAIFGIWLSDNSVASKLKNGMLGE